MRVLAVQNFPGSGLGQIETALREAGADIDLRRPYEGEALPRDATGHDAAILLGGGQNALADDTHPYFPALLDLARDFSARDRAVLGICLGAQLLARAFGGENRIGGATEFGWCEVVCCADAARDPLLAPAPDSFRTFQWHDDHFSLPPGAVRLASSRAAENQAFRIGRATYGFQFHFEADRVVLDQWNADYAAWLAERQPDWPSRFPREAALYGPAADALGLALARRWVKLV
jgi:GMP synthase-like glutamine amidotransferase